MAAREARLAQKALIDATPLPPFIPQVKECGASSAPLLSASFFIGARCRDYNDDYMQCKTEAQGKGEYECLKEGRRVTRCAKSVLADISTNCLTEFRRHWECLEDNNQRLYQCRRPEQLLNACVFDKLGLKKEIPGTHPKETPVHLRDRNLWGTGYDSQREKEPEAKPKAES